mgnify:CR=1 FL=1
MNKWTRQFQRDLHDLDWHNEMSDVVHAIGPGIRQVLEDSHTREVIMRFDPKLIEQRSIATASVAFQQPQPAKRPDPMTGYLCNQLLEDGTTRCQRTFATYAQLVLHQRQTKSHHIHQITCLMERNGWSVDHCPRFT